MSVTSTSINADSMRQLSMKRKDELRHNELRDLCEVIDNKIKSAANYGLYQCDFQCSPALHERSAELNAIYSSRGFDMSYDSFRQLFIITWEPKQ
jgi:hypothetical protein